MIDFESMLSFLGCPCSKFSVLTVPDASTDMVCEPCGSQYPISFGHPVLLRPDNDLFYQDDYRNQIVPVLYDSGRVWQSLISKASVSQRALLRLRELLEKMPTATLLVISSGCQRQWLDELLGSGDFVRIVYADIDVGADVDLFCGGHDLPFVDGSFDAVVTTAVLEHVLYPERVAYKITRVFKEGGLLYSELPFMQQVHEGVYDFTRYTLSEHKRLLNGVSEIDSGMVAGLGTALVWAIENFAIAFMDRQPLRKITKVIICLAFGWIKYFDLELVNKPVAMDGVSCTYLLGYKIEGQVPDVDIIARYVGAKHLRHS